MLPACFQLSEHVFPAVRAETARRLRGVGWTQSQIARALGVSQAMVSKYEARPSDDDALVLRLASDLEAQLVAGDTAADSWCAPLAASQADPAGEALRDLLAAEARLLAEPPLRVVPQIGMNLARCLPDATGPDEVLAYPGRLVEGGGRLLRPAPPAPRGSNHLAQRLLRLRASAADVTCMASIRGGQDVVAAVRRMGRRVRDVPAGAPVEGFTQGSDTWHDAGGIGIEPCLYLAGPDAVSVAETIVQAHREVRA